jgi:hypothetical protein
LRKQIEVAELGKEWAWDGRQRREVDLVDGLFVPYRIQRCQLWKDASSGRLGTYVDHSDDEKSADNSNDRTSYSMVDPNRFLEEPERLIKSEFPQAFHVLRGNEIEITIKYKEQTMG